MVKFGNNGGEAFGVQSRFSFVLCARERRETIPSDWKHAQVGGLRFLQEHGSDVMQQDPWHKGVDVT